MRKALPVRPPLPGLVPVSGRITEAHGVRSGTVTLDGRQPEDPSGDYPAYSTKRLYDSLPRKDRVKRACSIAMRICGPPSRSTLRAKGTPR